MQNFSPPDVALLWLAAQRAGLEVDRLRYVNPWSQVGPVADALQQAVRELDPHAAAHLQCEAQVAGSLLTTAVLSGLIPAEEVVA